jgi:hypothetical protein
VAKFVGWSLIIVGVLLTLTVFLMGIGIPMVGLGIVVLVAVSLVDRHARKTAEMARGTWVAEGPSVDPDADRRAGDVRNSMFGR